MYIYSKISRFNKYSMVRKQRKLSTETRKKISDSLKGKVKTEEQRIKISESMKKYWSTIPYENNEDNMEEYGKEIN